jgi:hypothetical protein
MSTTTPASLLDDDHAGFIQGSVSIVAASRDARNVPSIGRISGCRVAPDRRRVTVYLAAGQAPRLLSDIRDCRRLAVVFSRPSTHRSFQLKADDAVARPLAADEHAVVARYVAAFGIEISALGHLDAHARALLSAPDDDMVAIDFTPSAAFEQTPGPNAGKRIPLGR